MVESGEKKLVTDISSYTYFDERFPKARALLQLESALRNSPDLGTFLVKGFEKIDFDDVKEGDDIFLDRYDGSRNLYLGLEVVSSEPSLGKSIAAVHYVFGDDDNFGERFKKVQLGKSGTPKTSRKTFDHVNNFDIDGSVYRIHTDDVDFEDLAYDAFEGTEKEKRQWFNRRHELALVDARATAHIVKGLEKLRLPEEVQEGNDLYMNLTGDDKFFFPSISYPQVVSNSFTFSSMQYEIDRDPFFGRRFVLSGEQTDNEILTRRFHEEAIERLDHTKI